MRGAQTKVLKAVLRGRVTAHDIARSLGMPVERIYTPLRRLKDAGHIQAAKRRGKHSYKAYSVVNPCGFMLADIWGNRGAN